MKRCTYLLTALLLWGVLTVPAGAARRSVPVQADGKAVTSAAYVEQGVPYVPLRALLTALGGWEVWWDSGNGQAAAVSQSGSLWADPAADTVTVYEKSGRGLVTV